MGIFKGYRTYIIVILGVIFNGLVAGGYLSEDLRPTVNSVLTFLGLGTLRSAVK